MPSLKATPEIATVPETQRFRTQCQISRHSAAFFAGTMFAAAVGYLFKVYLAQGQPSCFDPVRDRTQPAAMASLHRRDLLLWFCVGI